MAIRWTRHSNVSLTKRVKVECDSLNTLVVSFMAQGLGRNEGQA